MIPARFIKDDRGISATEFALISPLLALVLLGMIAGWSYISQLLDTKTAIQVGARLVLEGSADEAEIGAAVKSAWHDIPEDANVDVNSYCVCGEVVSSCGIFCTGTTKLPSQYLTITAKSGWSGPYNSAWLPTSQDIVQKQTIRVR